MSSSSFGRKVGGSSSTSAGHQGGGAIATSVGKRTLVEQVAASAPVGATTSPAPVQFRLTGEASAAGVAPERVHELASAGTQGVGGALPHLDRIQHLFGRHDVSGIRTHQDEAATASAGAMGARAFATGDRVAFAGAPDLHTAAHEAAHVVQQRGGVQLQAGVGQAGDDHERHADQVADQVVQGRSVEHLLDRYAAPASAATSPSVQRIIIGLGGKAYTKFSVVKGVVKKQGHTLSEEAWSALERLFHEEKEYSINEAITKATTSDKQEEQAIEIATAHDKQEEKPTKRIGKRRHHNTEKTQTTDEKDEGEKQEEPGEEFEPNRKVRLTRRSTGSRKKGEAEGKWLNVPQFLYHSTSSGSGLKVGMELNNAPTYFSVAPQDHNVGTLLVFEYSGSQQVANLGSVETVNWLYQQIDKEQIRDVLVQKTKATVEEGEVTHVGGFCSPSREIDRILENWFKENNIPGWHGVLGQTGGEVMLISTNDLSKAKKHTW